MSAPLFDVTAYLNRTGEGSHFERKSLYDGEPERRKPRDRTAVRNDIARQVAGFANAEGGVLILGIEDDGTLTGHRYPPAAVETMLRVPLDRVHPSQAAGFRVVHQGIELLVFDVAMASTPVQVVGDGYPLRMGDKTVQARFEQIEALKFQGLVESFEARPSACGLNDLRGELLAEAQVGAGHPTLAPADYLVQRRLADWKGRSLVLRQAAELLFRQGLPDHPNAGIRIFRVVGTERRTGLEHNVEELPRIEGCVPVVLERAYEVVAGLLRRPSRLTTGGRFRQTSEYPDFSWKEAILNALGHRDYRIEGRGVEVWLFDDRMEVTSPGGLMPQVEPERLLALERVHFSRNPRLVRALVDLGFMRDQGEGIPRMFAEMEGEFLPRPELTFGQSEVKLTLRNTMTLSGDDRAWLEDLGGIELAAPERRALLEARRSGRVDNARMRTLTGLDTLGASKVLRNLRDRGLLRDQGRSTATYYQLAVTLGGSPELDPESTKLDLESTKLDSESTKLDSESTKLDLESTKLDLESTELTDHTAGHGPWGDEFFGLDPAHDVPASLRSEIASLGKRPGPKQLQRIVLRLCEHAPRDLATLSAILHRNAGALKRHIRPMIEEGSLRYKFPDKPNHPQQAYVAVQGGLEIEQPE